MWPCIERCESVSNDSCPGAWILARTFNYKYNYMIYDVHVLYMEKQLRGSFNWDQRTFEPHLKFKSYQKPKKQNNLIHIKYNYHSINQSNYF